MKSYNETKNSCGCEYKSIPSSTIFCWKYFRRNGVKNSIHDLYKKDDKWFGLFTTKKNFSKPTLLLNVYPQFHPSRALEFRAVVLAKRKALVIPKFSAKEVVE